MTGQRGRDLNIHKREFLYESYTTLAMIWSMVKLIGLSKGNPSATRELVVFETKVP